MCSIQGQSIFRFVFASFSAVRNCFRVFSQKYIDIAALIWYNNFRRGKMAELV